MSYDLVIARYGENLDWLNTVNLSKLRRIYIYNKNKMDYKINITNPTNKAILHIINIPNVGRESHTYLHHIITNYDDLSDNVIFTQGKLDYINYDDFYGDPNKIFTLSRYDPPFRLLFYHTELRENKYNLNLSEWMTRFVDSNILENIRQNGFRVKYGACFTIMKQFILSRSLEYYESMISHISDHINPEEGHFFERSWYYIFNLHKQHILNAPTHIVVGSGLSGSVIANKLAEENERVLIIEKREHIGGNCYDYIDKETGILVSKYGAHIFHTNREDVWEYVNKFGEWVEYKHRVYGNIGGELFPIPINIKTVNILCGLNITNEVEMIEYLDSVRDKSITEPKNSEEYCLSKFGRKLYELVIKDYTYKQWGKYPSELDVSVLQRIPIRYDFSEGYFTDKYQALPKDGYTKLISKMITHNNIFILHGSDYNKIKGELNTVLVEKVWYSGPIDAYFSESGLEKLEYRSINFKKSIINRDRYQIYPVINYPGSDVEYTRIVEYKNFPNQPISASSNRTYITSETTTDEGDPYYPVPNKRNADLYERYRELTKSAASDVIFMGRLASYKYFNMDEAIYNSLSAYAKYNNDRSNKYVNKYTDKYQYQNTNIKLKQNVLNRISFNTKSDAHIGLFNKNDIVIEIVVGGWENKKSCIRDKMQGENKVETSKMVCNVGWTDIYLEMNGRKINIYNSDSKTLVMSYIIKQKYDELNIHVSSWDQPCYWRLFI